MAKPQRFFIPTHGAKPSAKNAGLLAVLGCVLGFVLSLGIWLLSMAIETIILFLAYNLAAAPLFHWPKVPNLFIAFGIVVLLNLLIGLLRGGGTSASGKH